MALLVLEPIGGIAGDMFLAAALDLGVDPAALEAALRTLGVPGWRLAATRRTVHGIAGTHLDVVVEGEQPHERGLAEILALVDASGLSPRAKAAARDVFERIGRAEAKVHGIPLDAVHFHEVGAVDSIVDACGAAVALDLLGWPRVVCAPPELGRGLVKTAHGMMPVPPPAVLELLAGKAVRPGGPPGEAVTPTGAAILAAFADVGPLPAFVPGKIGYGVGTASWPDRPNVLRMTLGEEVAAARDDDLWVLECNLDDCTGQLVARAIEAALEQGALDAWAAPVTMKKGRPGILLGALVTEAARAAVTRALFLETTTLGVRRHRVERDALERAFAEVETPYGRVRLKLARLEGREVGAQPEYDDCHARAREKGVPVRDVMAAAIAAHRGDR
jgi:pyridinium-3,5-bisthiocarboxylic acid mononucleotide nickel chelatase